jgi:hypothetical protein
MGLPGGKIKKGSILPGYWLKFPMRWVAEQ